MQDAVAGGKKKKKKKSYWKTKRAKKPLNLGTCKLQIMILHSPIGFCDICKTYILNYSFPDSVLPNS